jgi:hypothetical protein
MFGGSNVGRPQDLRRSSVRLACRPKTPLATFASSFPEELLLLIHLNTKEGVNGSAYPRHAWDEAGVAKART